MSRGREVAWLLFVVVVGWSGHALAACPAPATTVFFVNGANTSMGAANASLEALAERLGSPFRGECLNFTLAYNFTFVPLTFDSAVVDAHVALYRAELALGNKVLLVAHSNGNVYADQAYARLTPIERTSVGVVAVATPLGSVPGNGPYVTLVEDTFIKGVPGALPPNTTNIGGACPEVLGCHAFVDVYLDGVASGPRIVQAVGDTIPRLVRPPGGAALVLELNQTVFHAGDTLRATLKATNVGPARRVDFYLGLLAPDGVTISFITGLSPLTVVTAKTSEPEKFQPLARNIELQGGLDLTIPDVLVMPAGFPPGRSTLFAAITVTGTADLAAPIAAADFTY